MTSGWFRYNNRWFFQKADGSVAIAQAPNTPAEKARVITSVGPNMQTRANNAVAAMQQQQQTQAAAPATIAAPAGIGAAVLPTGAQYVDGPGQLPGTYRHVGGGRWMYWPPGVKPNVNPVELKPGMVGASPATGGAGAGAGTGGGTGGGGAAGGAPPKPTTPPQPGYAWMLVNGVWVQKIVDPHDSQWKTDYATSEYDVTQKKTQLANELVANKAKFADAEKTREQWYSRNMYDTNAALASRGVFRSGGRDNAHAERERASGQMYQQANQQYGQLRAGEIASTLGAIDEQWKLRQQQLDEEAKQRWQTNNPASWYLAGYGGWGA